MKMSRRAKRMERHHQRNKRGVQISLVSMMDIFTILVFFLLVSSTNVQTLPSTKALTLPKSTAEQLPKENIVIVVNGQDVVVQGRKVASVADVLASTEPSIASLKSELDYLASRATTPAGPDGQRSITIMGDKAIPYQLLKKIMMTCTLANYGNISLAVNRKTEA